jgi:hypothetical protein
VGDVAVLRFEAEDSSPSYTIQFVPLTELIDPQRRWLSKEKTGSDYAWYLKSRDYELNL